MYRDRVFSPVTTIWGFLSQVLSEDHSCRNAVSQIIAHRAASGYAICSPNTTSYCNARSRIATDVLSTLARRTAEELQNSIADHWKWNGRSVFIVDGSSVSMPDKPKNQQMYPQVPLRADIRQELVGQLRKWSVKPFAIDGSAVRLLLADLLQLSASDPVVLVKIMSFAIRGAAIETGSGVQPRCVDGSARHETDLPEESSLWKARCAPAVVPNSPEVLQDSGYIQGMAAGAVVVSLVGAIRRLLNFFEMTFVTVLAG